VDIGIGVFDGVARVDVTPMVHNYIIIGIFGGFGVFGGPFNVLIEVMSSSYNVHIAFTNWQKIVIQVLIAYSMN
jgi:hypothetical protein